MKQLIMKRAASYFAAGKNCCHSVLLAANDLWSLEVSKDLLDATRFFGRGMASGCSCGALIGMEMALGVIQRRTRSNFKPRTAKQLHDEFVKTFGASCCRVLQKKQSLLKMNSREKCQQLTAEAAGILYEIVSDYPHL